MKNIATIIILLIGAVSAAAIVVCSAILGIISLPVLAVFAIMGGGKAR